MAYDNAKNMIDVGEIGNASTGDILYDGGVKINANTTQIYNTFGDRRLASSIDQYVHATGYYQKTDGTNIGGTAKLGSRWDIDSGSGIVTVTLEKGRQGECVEFINSNGSLSPINYLEIIPNDQFVSVATGTLKVTTPFVKVTLWCVDDSLGVSKWDYSITPLFADDSVELDATYLLTGVPRDINIVDIGKAQTIKLMLTAMSTDGRKFKASEVLLYISAVDQKVFSTEYAVLRQGHANDEDEIYSIDFKFGNTGYIVAAASSTTANLRLAIKIIDSQVFGVNK